MNPRRAALNAILDLVWRRLVESGALCASVKQVWVSVRLRVNGSPIYIDYNRDFERVYESTTADNDLYLLVLYNFYWGFINDLGLSYSRIIQFTDKNKRRAQDKDGELEKLLHRLGEVWPDASE